MNRISETKIEFNGITYYRLGGPGGFYKNNGKFLHRKVWEFFKGPIPKGFHIHHIDHDRDNNDISNLDCISAREHNSYHSKLRMEGKGFPKEALAAAAKWHATPEGRAANSRAASTPKVKRMLVCVQCGESFLTYKKKTCSPGCTARLRNGLEGAPRRLKKRTY